MSTPAIYGVDPGPEYCAVLELLPGRFIRDWILPVDAILDMHQAKPGGSLMSACRWFIEWPVYQGQTRTQGGLLRSTLGNAERLRDGIASYNDDELTVQCVSAARIRYDVAKYVPRRDGKADKFLRRWILEQGWELTRPPGCELPKALTQLRDALLTALWGEMQLSSAG
jgi:hypothetical protein